MVEAGREEQRAARVVSRRTRLRDNDLPRTREIEQALRDVRQERHAQMVRRTNAWGRLPGLAGNLDAVRRAEGTGQSGTLLGFPSSEPARRPGDGRQTAAPALMNVPGSIEADARPASETSSQNKAVSGAALTASGSPLPVLGRTELDRLVRRVAARGTEAGTSVERCLELLGALRDELYRGGVRAAVAVDDSVVGLRSAASSLAAGPGWGGVRSWHGVADAVEAVGRGAAAFVLAQRQGEALGHAWAAYNLGGVDGVVWVDVSAGVGRRVSGLAPDVAPSDARAVVIDPAGKVVAGALPEFMQSSSTAHAMPDTPMNRRYGAFGLEIEKRRQAASDALRVLADPTHTPAVLSWADEIVAPNGSRVPVDGVLVVKHRDTEGQPVGVSSRPLADWHDARRHAYGLLPVTHSFTLVQQGPTPHESEPSQLPFKDAYLVGFRGDARRAALALPDGTDAVIDYAQVVDFLFAADAELNILQPQRPILVVGADLAGEPASDPLEHPVAGQQLANSWDRHVWTTGSGQEPVLASAIPGTHFGPRFQLTEGDWWAGFRPDPTTAELGRLAEQVTGDRGRASDVLRWVRAIRLIYGPIGRDDAAFTSLLRGFWALEQTGSTLSPLTWAGLRASVSSYFARNGQAEPPLPTALPLLMASAADTAGMDLQVSGLPAPEFHSRRVWDWAASRAAINGNTGQQIQDPSLSASSAASVPSVMPGVSSSVSGVSGEWLGSGGVGVGGGVLSSGVVMRDGVGVVCGRNLTGGVVRVLEVGRVRVYGERPGVPLVEVVDGAGPSPWGGVAFVVWGEEAPGGVRLRDGRVVGAEELAGELSGDGDLAGLAVDVPVVLVVPYLANDRYLEFMRVVANRLGRVVWAPSGDGRLVETEGVSMFRR